MTHPRLSREAMRTRFEIVFGDHNRTDLFLHAAGEEALDEIVRWEALLSAYNPDSELYRVNRYAAKHLVRIDARVFAALERARSFAEATDGAFDLTVGPLLQLWGLGGNGPAGRIPSDTEIADACRLVGMVRHVTLDAQSQTVYLDRPGVRLDPGAIGKGLAIEDAADGLREAGIQNALLHGGTSTVRAIGSATGGDDGWTVAIQHPFDTNAHLAQANLRGTALSVSAVHGKSFRSAGRQFGHVIDPRTGWPVSSNVLAAVIAPSATDTDALSTALLVMGEPGLPTLRERYPDAEFLLASTDNDDGLRVVCAGESWRLPRNE